MTQVIFSVISDHGQIVLGILLLMALGAVLVALTLKNILHEQLTSSEYLALGMAGWLVPVSLITLLWFLFGSKPAAPFNLFLLISLLVLSTFFLLRFKPDPEPDSRSIAFSLLLFFLVSIPLRLAFVSKAILPSYFDSAAHYLLIKNILGHSTEIVPSLAVNYYHLGYHILTAFVASTMQAEVTKTMLILGQMILAILPLGAFFLVKNVTRSNVAGIFAINLCAFGWYMPAHAVDWGKYPALTSLGVIPFVLSLAYLLAHTKDTLSPRKRWALTLILGVGVMVSGFMHSRSLVIIGIACLAWIISVWQKKLPRAQQLFIFVLAIAAVTMEIVFVQKYDVLLLLFDPYSHKGILITVLILVLSIFAYKQYPQLTLACMLTIGFLMACLFIPVRGLVPGYANLTLLDRPFVEMILFMPLAFLGGLGLAGLQEKIQYPKLGILVGLIVCGVVWVNAMVTYDLYPSDCCVFVGHDDVTAMDWMNTKLPADVRFGISATVLKVLASGSFEGYVGGDAGIWITPLIDRAVIPLRYDTNFGEQATLDSLCQQGISHLYVGELGQSFNDSQLSAKPSWYKALLSMPKVRVYQVVGCN
jgi:hypothetical protein